MSQGAVTRALDEELLEDRLELLRAALSDREIVIGAFVISSAPVTIGSSCVSTLSASPSSMGSRSQP